MHSNCNEQQLPPPLPMAVRLAIFAISVLAIALLQVQWVRAYAVAHIAQNVAASAETPFNILPTARSGL